MSVTDKAPTADMVYENCKPMPDQSLSFWRLRKQADYLLKNNKLFRLSDGEVIMTGAGNCKRLAGRLEKRGQRIILASD